MKWDVSITDEVTDCRDLGCVVAARLHQGTSGMSAQSVFREDSVSFERLADRHDGETGSLLQTLCLGNRLWFDLSDE